MAVNPVNGASVPIVPKNSGMQLGQSDFLRLMTAQLSQQDPFNPVDNTQMVAQMAQFSSLAGVSESNTVLKQISEQLKAHTELLKDIKASSAKPATTHEITTQEG
ncbi:MAG: flagellar hook capping FlgD N-terminal domain-containing protein [Sphingopyxis sp.]|uniref:flagellar hook assembly protein FlgD n=1 Tax=Sphingopyxis sp. TaxID=1908224 RepID=UPI002AB9C26A|nr:flagellar hook capping FlgD N-terminal domain-containing protein [Sphingopyxis sp.]MDZ3831857.1 flagellar hook capping FlgD N-terminal domain-containing protein [Sphingopyxis sp.]